MKSYASQHFLAALLSTFVSQTDSVTTAQWRAKTRYLVGSRIKVGNRVYLALNTGTTAGSSPTHTSGQAIDGTVNWAFAFNAPAVAQLGSNLYLGIGGPSTWKAEPTPDDIVDDERTAVETIGNLQTLIRLSTANISLGVSRRTWASGQVITQWPSETSYTMVGESVYRCISNNAGAASTVQPSGNSLTAVELIDGYVWKYLGDISGSLDQQYGMPEAFALAGLYSDDTSSRWQVQNAALDGSLSSFTVEQSTGVFTTPAVQIIGTGTGAAVRADLLVNGSIKRIVVTNPGKDYHVDTLAIFSETGAAGSGGIVTATLDAGQLDALTIDAPGAGYTNARAFVVGDGTGAQVTLSFTSGYITGATIANPGTGYTKATIYIVPGTAGAVARGVMAPNGGHGKDMTKELPLEWLLVARRLTALDSGYVVNGKFRQVTLLTGVTVGSDAASSDILVGPAHPSPGTRTKAITSTARLMYTNNIQPVEHGNAQDEELKIGIQLTV